MNKLLTILALSLIGTTAAFAGAPCKVNCTPVSPVAGSDVNATAQQQQQSQAIAGNEGQGNGNSITYNNSGDQRYSGKYKVESVPGVSAPGLTTTLTETCMGSTTGGLAIMGLGISGGTTWKDEECVRRLNARELAQTLGEKDAAKELLCGNPEINAVYQSLGRPCLMKASNSYVVPGGALINYREPVEPKPRASHTPVAPVAVVEQPAPVVNEEVTDDQDIADTERQAILDKAEKAREEIRARHGF